MNDLTLKLLQDVVGGRLRLATLAPREGEQTRIGRIVTDSRQTTRGDVFWALPGSRCDGAAFAEEAYSRGATGIIGGRYIQPRPSCWSLEVENSLAALTRLAAWNRQRFTGTTVAVTGSVGKTTTRQMIHSVLSTCRSGMSSPKNYNNHVGLPLSMLDMRPDHDFAVLELAASASGEIAALAELAAPHVGVITRIGEAHLGGFGSPQAIARAKMELLQALPSDGWAVLCGDDPWMRRLTVGSRANTIWVGRTLDCDLVATGVQSRGGSLSFCIDGHPLEVGVWGRHHLTGALEAVAVGKIFGMSIEDIARGLAAFQAPPQRCQITSIGGATIINDTYNASPTAMRAALELLRDFDASGRRIVVCGDMRELGDAATPLHRQLGDEVVTLGGADLLLACGDHAQDVVAGAREAGMPGRQAVACRDPEDSLPHLSQRLEPGDVVLVKGSRALAMERVVAALQSNFDSRAA